MFVVWEVLVECGGLVFVICWGCLVRGWGVLCMWVDVVGGVELCVRFLEGKCRWNRGRGLFWVNFYW